jgi:signal transduction histidine kinase
MEQVDTLDAAIAEIRTAIFAMTARSDAEPSLRHRVLDIVTESAEALPAPPRLVFSGPVDLLVPPEVVEDVVAVVREGLANIARHARASSSVVSVTVSDSRLTIEIVDDGVGIPAGRTRSSGTANLDARATARGGRFDVHPRDPSGTLLEWSVPLER